MLGKLGISFYISKSNVGSTYGTAGSLVVLLLWVYFSSIILYFGAEFTKAYAIKYGSEIHPNQYAVTTKMVEVETGQQSVQKVEASEIKTTQEHDVERRKWGLGNGFKLFPLNVCIVLFLKLHQFHFAEISLIIQLKLGSTFVILFLQP